MIATTDGNVVVLPCIAALPKDEQLDAEDEETLTKLEVIRYNAMTYKQLERERSKNWSLETGKGKETMETIRMVFGQKVDQLCQKHPKIVLAPFFSDLTSGTTTLYGCKNITAAPEK